MTDIARRPGRPRDESIDAAILDATIDELIERGYLRLSVEAIASRAGIAKTTLYRRWPNTDDLVLEALRRFDQTTDPVEPELAPGRDELLFLLERMRRTWGDPRYAALMRRAAADGTAMPEVYRHFRDKLINPRLARMHEALVRAVDVGVIRPDVDLVRARRLLASPILSAAFTLKARVTRSELEFVVDTVLAGLAP
jgi:AcrR family transcriptional regulator